MAAVSTSLTKKKEQDAMLAALLETSFGVEKEESNSQTHIAASASQQRLKELQRKQAVREEAAKPLNSTGSMLDALDEAVAESETAKRQQTLKSKTVLLPQQKITCTLLDDPCSLSSTSKSKCKTVHSIFAPSNNQNGTEELLNFVHKTYKKQVFDGEFELKKKEHQLYKQLQGKEIQITGKSRKANLRHQKQIGKASGYACRQQAKLNRSKGKGRKIRTKRFKAY